MTPKFSPGQPCLIGVREDEKEQKERERERRRRKGEDERNENNRNIPSTTKSQIRERFSSVLSSLKAFRVKRIRIGVHLRDTHAKARRYTEEIPFWNGIALVVEGFLYFAHKGNQRREQSENFL